MPSLLSWAVHGPPWTTAEASCTASLLLSSSFYSQRGMIFVKHHVTYLAQCPAIAPHSFQNKNRRPHSGQEGLTRSDPCFLSDIPSHCSCPSVTAL